MKITQNNNLKNYTPGFCVFKEDNTVSQLGTHESTVSKGAIKNTGYYADFNINFTGSNAIVDRLKNVSKLIKANPQIMEALKARKNYTENEAIITFLKGSKMIEKSPNSVLRLLNYKFSGENAEYVYTISDVQNILERYEGESELLDYVISTKSIQKSVEHILDIKQPLQKFPKYIKKLINMKRPNGHPWIIEKNDYSTISTMLEIDPKKAMYLVQLKDEQGYPRFYDAQEAWNLLNKYSDDKEFERLKSLLMEKTPDGRRYKYDAYNLIFES